MREEEGQVWEGGTGSAMTGDAVAQEPRKGRLFVCVYLRACINVLLHMTKNDGKTLKPFQDCV